MDLYGLTVEMYLYPHLLIGVCGVVLALSTCYKPVRFPSSFHMTCGIFRSVLTPFVLSLLQPFRDSPLEMCLSFVLPQVAFSIRFGGVTLYDDTAVKNDVFRLPLGFMVVIDNEYKTRIADQMLTIDTIDTTDTTINTFEWTLNQ